MPTKNNNLVTEDRMKLKLKEAEDAAVSRSIACFTSKLDSSNKITELRIKGIQDRVDETKKLILALNNKFIYGSAGLILAVLLHKYIFDVLR